MVDVFRFHRYALRFFGVTFPGDIKWKWVRTLVDLYLAFGQACCILWALLFFRAAAIYTFEDFMNRVVGVTAGISVAGSVCKYVIFRTRGSLLLSLMEELGGFECNTPRGNIVKKVIRFYTVSVIMIIATHNMHPLFEEFHRSTPYYVLKQTGPADEVLRDFIFGLYATFVTLLGNVIGDVIFLTLTSQICHKLFLLANTLSYIGTSWDHEREDVIRIPGEVTDSVIIKVCVEEHNRLIRLKTELQDLFEWIILVQLGYSFADTCFTLFAVSQFDDMVAAINELLPQFIALFLEIFLYCWGGEMIHTHFEHLHEATYNNDWYNASPETRSSLLVMQSFTTKPVSVTAAIFHFNFKFYETICRETFSYYTIMYQFFSQK